MSWSACVLAGRRNLLLLVFKPTLINSICFTVTTYGKVYKSQFIFWEHDHSSVCSVGEKEQFLGTHRDLLYILQRVVNGNRRSKQGPAAVTDRATSQEELRRSKPQHWPTFSPVATLETGLLPAGSRWNSQTQQLRSLTIWFHLSLLRGCLKVSGNRQFLSPHVSLMFCIFLIRDHSSQHIVIVLTWLTPSLDCVLFILVKTF